MTREQRLLVHIIVSPASAAAMVWLLNLGFWRGLAFVAALDTYFAIDRWARREPHIWTRISE